MRSKANTIPCKAATNITFSTFLLTEPLNTVLGYYEGDRVILLQESELFWIICRDQQYAPKWQCG